MTDRLINLLLLKLKLIALLLVIALVCIFSFSFSTSRDMADDFWKQLGMTRDQGTESVKQSFLYGYLYHYGAKNARNIALNNRTALANDMLNYSKQYISSAAFKKEYDNIRANSKPEEPTSTIRSKEEIRKEKIAETEKSIKSAEETMKISADMAKAMKPTVEYLKKTLEDFKDPNSKNLDLYVQSEKYEYESKIRSYNERLTAWEKDYPADYREKIKLRLRKFLDLAATVDFNAELKQVGNKKKFVNPAYEAKSSDWKQIFRAGKEVIEPSRKFAEQWLLELGK